MRAHQNSWGYIYICQILSEGDAAQIAEFKRTYYLPELEVNNLARKPVPTFPSRSTLTLNTVTGDVVYTHSGDVTLEQNNGPTSGAFGEYTHYPHDEHILRVTSSTTPKVRRDYMGQPVVRGYVMVGNGR